MRRLLVPLLAAAVFEAEEVLEMRWRLLAPGSTAQDVLEAAALQRERLDDQLQQLEAAVAAACLEGDQGEELREERAVPRPRCPSGGERERVHVVLEA